MIRALALLALLAMPSAAVPMAQDAFAVTARTRAAADGAPALVRLYETTYEVDAPGRATTSVRLAVTAFDAAGRDEAAVLRVVHGGFRDLRRLSGTLYDAAGREVRTVGRRDADETALASIYDDLRLSTATLYADGYPFTVEWRYEVAHRGVLGWPSWFPQPHGRPTEAASFTLSVPAGTVVRSRARDVPEGVSVSGDRRDRYVWSVSGRPHVLTEPFGPEPWQQAPVLRIGTDRFEIGGAPGRLDTWQAFGAWYAGLSEGRQVLPPAARSEALRIVEGAATNREKARRLYRHLQETTRYVSIQLGLGGWQPYDAAYVFERRYGDCKALTNYLQALLGAVGVRADPVLIQTGEAGSTVDPAFPDNAFDHVVLRLPMRTAALDETGGGADGEAPVWLECTSPYAAFGQLGAFTEGRPGLLAVADGARIVTTPTSPPEANAVRRTATLRLDARGGAALDARWTLVGEPRADALAALDGADATARAGWVQSLAAFPSVDVLDADLGAAAARPDTLSLGATLAVPHAARRAGTRLLVGLVPFASPVPDLPPGLRATPLRLGAARLEIDSVRIVLPDGATVHRLPEPVELTSAVGRYTLHAAADGDALVVTRTFRLDAFDRPASDYADAQRFLAAVAAADAEQAVVRLN